MTGSSPRAIPALTGFAYGGDYSPEQWPEEVWAEDVRLMKAAGVNLATVGVFSWAMLEPAPGRYDFGWLDRVLDLLAAHGVAADLATATATPPPWFSHAHPQSLPVGPDGRRLWYGSRQGYCPSSPEYRRAATALVAQLAARYAGHPALALWHVNNEYGCHISRCWCDTSAEAFRTWLRRRYGTIDALNQAWGTAFWSQRYTDFEQVLPTRDTPSFVNPTQQLDFRRFSSDELLDCFRAERDLLHRLSPGVPVTTNLMAGMLWDLDYWAWAPELDVLSTDHYVYAEADALPPWTQVLRPPAAQVAFAADLARSLAGGRPWLLMEHAPGAVNWQPRNLAKVTGQLRHDSLGYVARGADAVLYFQWRASRAGAEKWHAGMLPHAGTDSKGWQEVVALGGELAELSDVVDSTVDAEVAILLDWSSLWAQDHPNQPSVDMNPIDRTADWHNALWNAGFTCDFVHPEGDLTGYRMVLVPALYMVTDAGAANLASYVAGGGTAMVGPFSGVADAADHIRLGGYPGAWRDLLGIRVQEHFPLLADQSVTLSDGSTGLLWTELATTNGASTLLTYQSGPLAGKPALTRHGFGEGAAYYLNTHLTADGLGPLLTQLCAEAGVVRAVQAPPGVDVTRRSHLDGRAYVFLANHTDAAVEVTVDGTVLAGGDALPDGVRVPAGGLAIVRQPAGELDTLESAQ
jgi:beta-galactosidase